MHTSLNIRLPEALNREISKASKSAGQSVSDFVRDALKRKLDLDEFHRLCAFVEPYAVRAGFLTDDDVVQAMQARRDKRREAKRLLPRQTKRA